MWGDFIVKYNTGSNNNGNDKNPGPPKYEAGMLTIQTCSAKLNLSISQPQAGTEKN
jgi:hypothetical protein